MPLSAERLNQQREVLISLKSIAASICRDKEGLLPARDVLEKFQQVMSEYLTPDDITFWLTYYGLNIPKSGVYKSHTGFYHVVIGITESVPALDLTVVHGVLQEQPRIFSENLKDFNSIANNQEPRYTYLGSLPPNSPYMKYAKYYEPIMRNLDYSFAWSDAALQRGIVK